MTPQRDWFTIAEAAREKGVTPQAVSQAIADGRLQSLKTNGTVLIHRTWLDAWEPRQPGAP